MAPKDDRPQFPSRAKVQTAHDPNDPEIYARLGRDQNFIPTAMPPTPPAPLQIVPQADPDHDTRQEVHAPKPSVRRRDRDYERPAPTEAVQLKLPDYLVARLRDDAHEQNMTLKEYFMELCERAGYEIKPIDFRDLRRR